MACTKETYTASATWTASQLAQLFEDAFIDAGLMTDWFDSFANGGIENRILRVQYDATKTYGTTFYWWMFSTSGVFLHVATEWNASTNVPNGTLYVDYFSTSTNTTNNHWQLFAAATSNTVDLVRYTSGADANQSWFTIKRLGGIDTTFTIIHPSKQIQPWLDLEKGFLSGVVNVAPSISASLGRIAFARGPLLRREITAGAALLGNATGTNYTSLPAARELLVYAGIGRTSSTTGFATNYPVTNAIILPTSTASVNPAYTDNYNPVFYGVPFNPYVTDSLPSDFGLTFHYDSNAFEPGDTLVVTAGTEEWEVLDSVANTVGTGATPLFLARMI
jgi:hypothetical protein